jgi:hypothetical protein
LTCIKNVVADNDKAVCIAGKPFSGAGKNVIWQAGSLLN